MKITKSMKPTLAIAVAVGSLASANAAVTVTSTAPTVNGEDIAQLTTNRSWNKGFNNGKSFGQSFNTGSDAAGYALNAISFQTAVAQTGVGVTTPASFTVRVIEITAGDGTSSATYSTVATDAGHTFTGDFAIDDWFTWTLNSSVSLDANKLYGVDVTVANAGSGAPFSSKLRVGNGTFANGRNYLSGGGTLNLTSGEDAVFHADITAVPEPSTTALLGLGGLALILRRRK